MVATQEYLATRSSEGRTNTLATTKWPTIIIVIITLCAEICLVAGSGG